MSDDRVSQFPAQSTLDTMGELRKRQDDVLQKARRLDPRGTEYAAAQPGRIKDRMESFFFLWDDKLTAHGIMYPPFMSNIKSDGDSYIAFTCDGRRYSLIGHHLFEILLGFREHRWAHIRVLNQDYHEAIEDGAPCIERLIIQDEDEAMH